MQYLILIPRANVYKVGDPGMFLTVTNMFDFGTTGFPVLYLLYFYLVLMNHILEG